MRKTILLGRPSLILATLGGAAGVLLFGAVVAVSGAAGVPAPGVTEAIGGMWIGSSAAFLVGWLVLPSLMVAGWKALPGHAESLAGALLKGLLFGLAVWVAAGLLLPLIGARAGLFGAAEGIGGALALLVASVGYGVVTAAIASMGGGMAPLESLGWEGHGAGRAA